MSRSLPTLLPGVALALLLPLAGAGCQTLTAAQALEEAHKLRDALRQESVAAKAEREREERRAREAHDRALRLDQRYQAASFLAVGKPESTLDLIEKIYNPPPRREVDEKTGEARSVPTDAPALDPDEDAQFLALKGAALHALGPARREEALAAFRSAVERDPTLRTARRNLGQLLFADKRYAEAIEAWKRELADGYRDAELLQQLGQAYYELALASGSPAEMEAARVALEQALIERPRDAELRRLLASIEYQGGRFAEAIRHLEELRRDHPLDPELLELLGRSHLHLGDRARALGLLELAAGIKPPESEGARILAELCEGEGLAERAGGWFLRAFGAVPKAAPAEERFRVGRILLEAGRAEEALPWLSAVEEREARRGEAQAALGRAYSVLGRSEEAVAAFEAARKLRPADGEVQLELGRLYLAKKQWGPAVDAFARASAAPAVQAEAIAGLAEAAYARGNLEMAVRLLRKAREAKPGEARFEATARAIEEELRARCGADAVASGPAGG